MEEKKQFIINVIFYALVFGLVYLGVEYLLPVFLPFIIGYIIALISVKTCKKIFKKDTKVLRIINTVLLYVLVIGIVVLLTIIGVNKLIEFFNTIPSIYKESIDPTLNIIEEYLRQVNSRLPFEIRTDVNVIISDFLDSIRQLASSFATSIVSISTSLISNTTQLFIQITLAIVTSFFFVLDYEMIFNYFETKMSKRMIRIYDEIKSYTKGTLLTILKSYLAIMFITFVELCIGLLILGVENAVLISLTVSILDILPVLGVGTVLIPWGIIDLILGQVTQGVGILIVYLIITIIRNIIEPKIVGGDLGLHPLATLLLMMIGLQVFGAIGMFGLPLAISFLLKRETIRVK